MIVYMQITKRYNNISKRHFRKIVSTQLLQSCVCPVPHNYPTKFTTIADSWILWMENKRENMYTRILPMWPFFHTWVTFSSLNDEVRSFRYFIRGSHIVCHKILKAYFVKWLIKVSIFVCACLCAVIWWKCFVRCH